MYVSEGLVFKLLKEQDLIAYFEVEGKTCYSSEHGSKGHRYYDGENCPSCDAHFDESRDTREVRKRLYNPGRFVADFGEALRYQCAICGNLFMLDGASCPIVRGGLPCPGKPVHSGRGGRREPRILRTFVRTTDRLGPAPSVDHFSDRSALIEGGRETHRLLLSRRERSPLPLVLWLFAGLRAHEDRFMALHRDDLTDVFDDDQLYELVFLTLTEQMDWVPHLEFLHRHRDQIEDALDVTIRAKINYTNTRKVWSRDVRGKLRDNVERWLP